MRAAQCPNDFRRQNNRVWLVEVTAECACDWYRFVWLAEYGTRASAGIDDRGRMLARMSCERPEPGGLLAALAAAAQPTKLCCLAPIERRLGSRCELDGRIGVLDKQPLQRCERRGVQLDAARSSVVGAAVGIDVPRGTISDRKYSSIGSSDSSPLAAADVQIRGSENCDCRIELDGAKFLADASPWCARRKCQAIASDTAAQVCDASHWEPSRFDSRNLFVSRLLESLTGEEHPIGTPKLLACSRPQLALLDDEMGALRRKVLSEPTNKRRGRAACFGKLPARSRQPRSRRVAHEPLIIIQHQLMSPVPCSLFSVPCSLFPVP